MSLTLAEFQIHKRLPGGKGTLLLFEAACLLGWTTTGAIAELVGMGKRRAELQLAELVRDGYLDLDTEGARGPGRRVRYRARITAIVGDRSSAIVGDRSSAIVGDRSSSPDTSNTRASGLDPSLDCKIRPTGGVQGTDARTDSGADVRESDVQYVVARWGTARSPMTGAIAWQKLEQLRGFGFTRREIRDYLADPREFAGLERVDYPLGVVCHESRALPWLEATRRRRPAPRPPVRAEREEDTADVVPPAQLMADIERMMKGQRK